MLGVCFRSLGTENGSARNGGKIEMLLGLFFELTDTFFTAVLDSCSKSSFLNQKDPQHSARALVVWLW